MPPALILLAALAISSYQRQSPVRPIAPSIDLNALTRSGASKAELAALPPKVVFRSEAEPESTGPTEATQSPAPSAPATPGSFFEMDSVAGLHPVRPGEVSTPAPDPAGRDQNAGTMANQATEEVSKDEILRDIQREADEANARREQMEMLKPRAQAILAAEAVAKIQEGRIPFRNELRQLIAQFGNDAGPEIDHLCDAYGRDMPPEARAAYHRALRSTPRLGQQGKVDLMRSAGLPEPVILDYLAHGLHMTLNTRGGPRDKDEVRVRAGKLLLQFPLATAKRTAPKPLGAPPR
jgi:hypothetical protein